MAVILSALLFLFGAPALLLWMGRLISRIGRKPPEASLSDSRTTGDSWYYRPVQPLFGGGGETIGQGEPATAPASSDSGPWYQRPSKPVFSVPTWLRHPLFAGHRTD